MKLSPRNNFMLMPNGLASEYIKKLGPHAFAFFVALWFQAHRYSKPNFFKNDEYWCERFGFSRRTLTRLRGQLKKEGLIDYKVGYRYGDRAMATRYMIFPSKEIRKHFRIRLRPKRLATTSKRRRPARPP